MKDRSRTVLRQIVFVTTIFLFMISLLRVYEYFTVAGRIDLVYHIVYGLLFDVSTALSFSAVVFIPIVLLGWWDSRISYASLVGIYCLYIVVTFGLIQYFSITLLPLGADFFGYSWKDIKTTIGSSGGFDALTIFLLITFAGLFAVCCYLPTRQKLIARIPVPAGVGIIILMFSALFFGVRASNDRYTHDLEYYAHLNKVDFFFQRAAVHFQQTLNKDFDQASYPLLHPRALDNSLSAYFNLKDSLPNIVFVLIEGLGRDFTGKDASYEGFTPFLDSLAGNSLYWKNALSNAGRTFGVLPSILGSLPYGKQGFMSYGNDMPDHHTIISLLKPYGYASHFFYGGNPNFDNQDIFLERQGIDYMLDETKFPHPYRKMEASNEGFSWGYADRAVFNRSLEIIAEEKMSPRLDIYLTLSTHEPFRVPDQSFRDVFDSKIKLIAPDRQKKYLAYRNIFECLLYTDHALQEYFARVSELPGYSNTIFIITGDHRLVPVPAASKLSRFHVPLLIFSPLLKRPETFENIITHSDVTPALLNLLNNRYKLKMPDTVSFISANPLPGKEFSSAVDLALIRNKNETLDYIEGKYMLSENRLFQITPSLDLEPLADREKLEQLSEKLRGFVGKSVIACEKNQLLREKAGQPSNVIEFTQAEKKFLERTQAEKSNPDLLFVKARALAFEKKYVQSRTLSRYILSKSPNYHDARILLARTFAWDGQYDTARYFLQEVLHRAPHYEDALIASIDVEYWSGNHEKALALSQGLTHQNVNDDLRAREARSLLMVGKKKMAEDILKKILQVNPDHQLSLTLLPKLQ